MNFNPKRNTTSWKPGIGGGYGEYLKKLTPEQRAEHMKKRYRKQAMKKAMKQVTAEFQAEWTAELHNAAWGILKRARDKNDPIAFAAVWDRIVGKPKVDQNINLESDRPLPFKDEDLK